MATGLCRGLLTAAINNTLQGTGTLLGGNWLPLAMLSLSRNGGTSREGQLLQQKPSGLDQELTCVQARPQAHTISRALVSQLKSPPYLLTQRMAGHPVACSPPASQSAWSASWVTSSAPPATQWPATASTSCHPHISAPRQQPLPLQHHLDSANVQQQSLTQQHRQRRPLQQERQQPLQQELLEVASSWRRYPAHHPHHLPLPPAATSQDSALYLLPPHALTPNPPPFLLFPHLSLSHPLWPVLAPTWMTDLGQLPGSQDSSLPGAGPPHEPSNGLPYSAPGGGAQGLDVPMSCARGNTYQPSRRKRVNKHGMAKRLSNPKSRAMLLNRIKKGRWRLTVDQFV